jgi:hypothetical protein
MWMRQPVIRQLRARILRWSCLRCCPYRFLRRSCPRCFRLARAGFSSKPWNWARAICVLSELSRPPSMSQTQTTMFFLPRSTASLSARIRRRVRHALVFTALTLQSRLAAGKRHGKPQRFGRECSAGSTISGTQDARACLGAHPIFCCGFDHGMECQHHGADGEATWTHRTGRAEAGRGSAL